MSDEQSIQQSIDAFNNLSDNDLVKLRELNVKIQNHTGLWGTRRGGEKNDKGSTQMPWIEKDPLIYEFLDFMDDRSLLPVFAWSKWKEGSNLFESDNAIKYKDVDVATALKLIYAATRKDRFSDGALVWAFESGGFVQLVSRIASLADL